MNSRYLISIDDDPLNNLINKILIEKFFPEIRLECFTESVDGLAHIISLIPNGEIKVIILLDVVMPPFSCWDLLEKLSAYSTQIKKNFRIFLLSATIDPGVINKANFNELIAGYIEKPLSKSKIEHILSVEF